MTDDFKEQFLAERARALATVILTRRGDLTVTETKAENGLDLLVSIERKDKPMRLMLGVLLGATFSPVTANQVFSPTLSRFRRRGKFTYPVCLLFFTMRDEQAFFSWLAEPVVAEDGSPKLVRHKKANCMELTDKLVGQVVTRVIAWYDALEAVLTAE